MKRNVKKIPLSILETAEILSDKRLMAAIRQSEKEIREGKVVPWELIKERLKKGGRMIEGQAHFRAALKTVNRRHAKTLKSLAR